MTRIKITECPRDALQGLHNFVPTDIKAAYINQILKCGFDTVDFGSFVSAKAIPQMQDTAEVLDKLELTDTKSKLLAIIANYRGAEEAAQHKAITYLGFPFSISETFQKRNTNSTIDESFANVERIQALCGQKNKRLRIYLSMGFGNPYGDEWSTEILLNWANRMVRIGINDIYVADTIGIATPEQIADVFSELNKISEIQFGAHLHSTPNTWFGKIDAAYKSGCRQFDTTIKGYGGCPMAADDLTGNIATENLLGYLKDKKERTGVKTKPYAIATAYAGRIFG